MKIEKFHSPETGQMSRLGSDGWSVSRLIDLSKDFKVMSIPLDHININNIYEGLNLRGMVMHMNAVNDADLSFPIILDEDGELMDGRHRIMKCLLLGKHKIKAVRFDENPEPCEVFD